MMIKHRRQPRPHWHWHFANFAVVLNILMTAAMLVITVVEHLDKVATHASP